MKDPNDTLELDSLPAPGEPLTAHVSEHNAAVLESELTDRMARLRSILSWRQRWSLTRQERRLWKRLNRDGYNRLVSERFELYQKYENVKKHYVAARESGRPPLDLLKLAAQGRRIAAAGRALNDQIARLAPLHDQYESVRLKLEAHEEAVRRDREDAENRAAFFAEKETYEELIKAALRKMPKVHHIRRDAKGNEYVDIPEFEEVFTSVDRHWFQIRTSSQSWFQRWRGTWSNRLPYGVLPRDLMSDETLEALSVATDRSVTVERGQKGQTLFWVVNRLDSPDGVPSKVGFNKVIQYYPADDHAKTPWPMGVTKNRKVEWLTFEDYPNVLIAGAAGGGKSNELNAIIATLVSMNAPELLRLMLIDNKGGIEFTHWKGIPHLIGDMIKDETEVLAALERIVAIIRARLVMFERIKAKKLSAFNAKVKPGDQLPRVIVVVDEMSTLTGLDDSAEIQHALKVITAQGRAVGVHVILCTQHVSVNIIEGAIKTNMQVRASTKMPSEVSSRIILDTMSAATLPNIPGRMVFSLGRSETIAQAPLISDAEIAKSVMLAKEFPPPNNAEFAGAQITVQEKFTREDLIAVALENFAGKLPAQHIHESIGGNDTISLRNLKTMIQELAKETEIVYENQRYKIGRLGKAAILKPVERPTDHKLSFVQ